MAETTLPEKKTPKKRVGFKIVISRIFASITLKINGITSKIKSHIIKAWLKDFEPQYFKTLNPVIINSNDPGFVYTTLSKRLKEHEYQKPLTIIIKYSPDQLFSLYSTYTQDELEMAEFIAWKKAKNQK
jgi:hypothetical protein